MYPKVKETLDGLLRQFKESDSIPQAVSYSMFPIPNLPSSKWSLLNHLLMIYSGTKDARGFKQWKEVNRHVKKGAKAIHILVPNFKKEKNEEDVEELKLKGFMTANVFRVEDTEGEALDYQQLEIPDLPLLEKAKEWGISVEAVPGNFEHYGYYSSGNKKIALATKEESVFFHELTHVADEKANGLLIKGQDPLQEVVAELGALALCHLVGKDGSKYIGNSYRYIEKYAKELQLTPHAICLKVIHRVEKALNLILDKHKILQTS
jgi:hypothetical protein